VDAWLTPAAVIRWSDMAYDRETLRLMKKLRARKPPSSKPPSSKPPSSKPKASKPAASRTASKPQGSDTD